jgi:Fe-S oxidoreductase
MIFTLMVTDFLAFGGVILERGVTDTTFYPGGALGASILSALGDSAQTVAAIAYWIHCACVLVFLNFLPIGKHFHVITGIPNVFFRELRPYGQVPKMVIDLEDEDPKFGMRSSADIEWKMILDSYSCTECGRCTMHCPTALTDKPLSHRQLNKEMKKSFYEDQEILLSGDDEKKAELPDLVGGNISADTLWACTTCGSCEQECPVFIENVPRIIQMRQYKVMMEGDITPELQRAYTGMENNNNPWGVGFDQRDAWAQGLDVLRMADWMSDAEASKDNPPLLYWVGCAGSFDDRTKKVTLAMVKILKAAGVPFAILGKEEGCTGDSARRTGNEYLFQMLAEANVEILNNYGVKNILTTCPHCLHTIKREYPQFEGNFEVIHHTSFIDNLIKEGKIKLQDNGQKETVALHDSCYLGRYHDIYDAPRNIVNAVPGAQLVEVERNKSRSVCCGAGGGRFWMEEHIGERINVHRSKELAEANTSQVGANCPFCITMISDGMKDEAVGKEDVTVRDLAEIVADCLPDPEPAAAPEPAADEGEAGSA